ncbi:MAG: translation elongation factor EF-G [Neolewinella sp.]|jgi:translation elongation factor EF-G
MQGTNFQVCDWLAGDVMRLRSTNRGQMSGRNHGLGIQRIQSQSPVSAMLDYATPLRSIKASEGSFSMRDSLLEPLSGRIQDSVAKCKFAVKA